MDNSECLLSDFLSLAGVLCLGVKVTGVFCIGVKVANVFWVGVKVSAVLCDNGLLMVISLNDCLVADDRRPLGLGSKSSFLRDDHRFLGLSGTPLLVDLILAFLS